MGLLDFFKRVAASLDEHTIVESYEADLLLIDGDRRGAKAAEFEFTRLKPGHTKLEIEIKKRAGIPEGDQAVVLIHCIEVARVTILKLQADVKLYVKEWRRSPADQTRRPGSDHAQRASDRPGCV